MFNSKMKYIYKMDFANLMDSDKEFTWQYLFHIYVSEVGVGEPTLASYIWNQYSKSKEIPDAFKNCSNKIISSQKSNLCIYIHTIFFKNNKNVILPKSEFAMTARESFDRALRKCSATIHKSCYNEHDVADWDPMNQYELFYWAGCLWNRDICASTYMWDIINSIVLCFPKNVQTSIRALYKMSDLVEKQPELFIIQSIVLLSQVNDWKTIQLKKFIHPEVKEKDVTELYQKVGKLDLEDLSTQSAEPKGSGGNKVPEATVSRTPIQCYREFAMYLDSNKARQEYMEMIFRRIKVLSSIRKLPRNNSMTAIYLLKNFTPNTMKLAAI